MSAKRPHEPDGSPGDSKRIRSNDGSPAAAPSAGVPHGESEAERKKRELKERMAQIKARQVGAPQNGTSVAPGPLSAQAAPPPRPSINGSSDQSAKAAEAQRKIQEIKERMAAKKAQAAGGGPHLNATTAQQQPSEKDERIAEARKRAAAMAKQKTTSVPSAPTPPPRQDGRGARGGLGVGLHPSLIGDPSGPSTARGKAAPGPKFSTTRGNQQPEAPQVNPYLAPEEDADARQAPAHDDNYDSSLAAKKGGERKTKQLIFNQKGKFMAQANALRQQARLEEMKRRIAAQTRKVEIEEASDKAFLVPMPPDVEWWDEGLLPEGQGTYDDCLEKGRNKIDSLDSIITALVQHPVLLQAPQDKFVPAPKPLMLTTQEQKKLRRQRRMADMKEEQAKIRLGLVEPPPPKVKKSNMMRVLGEQAVKDPTAVEARVNKEIAQRAYDHNKANEERALTKEQWQEKLEKQQAGDEAKGVKIAVYRVDNLSSGKHRFQIDKNAKDNNLTGIVVIHPEMNLIIVEGGGHSMNAYRKLMLNRIKWTENALNTSNTNSSTFTGHNERVLGATESSGSRAAEWCNPLDASGELKDLSENRCLLVWEGDEAARSFPKWRSRACETDGEARDVLRKSKMENMWTLARSM